MDWLEHPGQASIVIIVGFALEVLVCFGLWFVTEKCKLPAYRRKLERRTELLVAGLSSSYLETE